MSNHQVVTIYTFQLDSTTNEPGLITCSEAFNRLLVDMPGFHYRSLAQIEDGVWQDISYWESEGALQQANEKIKHDEVANAFMAHINSSTVKNHTAIIASCIYPGMA